MQISFPFFMKVPSQTQTFNIWKKGRFYEKKSQDLPLKTTIFSSSPPSHPISGDGIYLFSLCFWVQKNPEAVEVTGFFAVASILATTVGCGGRTWTNDLRVMSPTSYQLLYPAIYGAGDRGRTGTGSESHGILSPGRLPIPPHRRSDKR